MDNLLKKIKDFLLELFFPSFCLGCQKEGTYLCEDCKATLDISELNYCLGNKNSQNLSGLYFALPYKERALTRKLIHQFKYQPYIKALAKTLALLLAEHFFLSGNNKEEVWRNSVLIPIPLDKKKLKSRGYNQAEELAKELSKILQTPMVANILIKTKSTRPQMELSKEQREKNLQGAFAISPSSLRATAKQSFNLKDKKIFLVDDVYTTGSTMEECAKVLKEAGAKQVWGIAIAREE